ncbi:MAG: hypothetical protein ABR567_17610 [Myxococcales bacterium]|nr:hypothetical protein [Myxococcales bacterium]
MEPLGAWEPYVAHSLALGIGVLAVLAAAVLLELSRTLAETYRGRWFAGNGRDVFHVGAAGVLAAALFVNGLPPALACLVAASLLLLPLVVLDSLPPRRPVRLALLLALVGLAAAPPLIEPRSIVGTANLVARYLFPH